MLCDDHDVVGSDFVVSEYRTGEVVWASVPPSMADQPDAGHRIGLATVDALADLHLVDPAACDLADLGRPDGFIERQLAGWRGRWELVATPDHDAAMSAVGERLERAMPARSRATFLHNDFKLDNCQFSPGEPDRVTSVFDWDMATLGDPLVDLGTLLNYWPDPSDTPDDRAFHVPGMERWDSRRATTVVERYAERTGIRRRRRRLVRGVRLLATAVICQQLHQRFVRGESTDERMATPRRQRRHAGPAGRTHHGRAHPGRDDDHRPGRQGRRRHRRQPRSRSRDGARPSPPPAPTS